MSETNESGNRWEKAPADQPEQSIHEEAPDMPVDPIEVPAAAEAAVPEAQQRRSRLPGWMTGRTLAAAGAAAAVFVGGGGLGYALGVNHDDGHAQFPDRFGRADFDGQRPGGQFPGNGQGPGGPSFQGPGSQQGSPGLSQGDDSGSDSGTSS